MALNLSQTSVLKLYNTVIEDVIAGVRDSFIDEGIDEQVLQELKQLWENKLMSSKAVEVNPEPPEPQVPQITTHKSTGVGKVNIANHYATSQQQQASAVVNPTIQSQQTQQQQQIASQSQQQQISHRPQVQANVNQQAQQQVQQVVTVAPTPVLDRQVPVQITLPAQPGVPDATPRILTIHVPASAIQGNQLHTILTGPVISAAMGLPTNLASTVLQQHVNSTLQGQSTLAPIQVNQPLQVVTQSTNSVITQRPIQGQTNNIAQLDGELGDTSDEDEDEEEDENDDEDEDFDEKEEEENEEAATREEEPLNSEDDVTDDDPTDLFDTDNVVVCQYDKITRSRNKWKFYLKDGIMNLTGKDYVFQRANGDAEW